MIHTLAVSTPMVKLRVSDALPVQQHTALAGVSPTPDGESTTVGFLFFHALYSTRALIRGPAFACALELPEHWETLESEGSQDEPRKIWRFFDSFDFVAPWNTYPSLEDVQLSRILLLRSDDFSQHGPATEVRTSLCIYRHWYSTHMKLLGSQVFRSIATLNVLAL